MKTSLCSFVVGIVLLLVPQQLAAQDKTAAQAYTDYVSEFIPLSFDLARQNAGIKEAGLFVKLESEAQAHMVLAADDVAIFGYYIPEIKGDACTLNADGTVDLETSYKQYILTGQLLEASNAVGQHRDAYKKIRSDLASACNKSFDHYQIENINMDFLRPDIELADGVYVQNGEVFFVTLAKSLWQLIPNHDEQQDIDDQVARLTRERAKSVDYRKFAAQACQESQTVSEKMFAEYDKLEPAFDDFLATVPQDQLTQRRAALQGCFARISDAERSTLEQAARASVRAKLLGQTERESQLKAYILAQQRIRKTISDFKTAACSSDAPLINGLLADAALGHALGLKDDLDLQGPVDQAIRDRRNQCKLLSRSLPRIIQPVLGLSNASFLVKTTGIAEPFSEAFARGSSLAALPGDGQAIPACVTINGYSFGPLCDYLTKNGPTAPVGDSGAYTGPDGSLCTYSQRAEVGSYTVCGGSAFGEPFVAADPYGTARAIIAAATELPGQYNLKRGALVGSKLEQQIKSIRESVQQLTIVRTDILAAQVQYAQQVFEPAGAHVSQVIAQERAEISSHLVPLLSQNPALPPVPGPDFGDPGFSLSSDPIHDLRRDIEHSANAGDLRNNLETLWLVDQYRAGTLASADQAGLRDLYQQYFNSAGLPNEKALGPALGKVSQEVSQQLSANFSDPQSIAVRYEMSRALFGLASTDDPDRTANGYGSLGFGVAADMAYTENDTGWGDQFLSIAMRTADIALGVVPVVGGVNDATQILFGIATGRDYTGHEMRAGDYALRGLGVALSVLPAAEPIIKVGSVAISEFFVKGATLLRRLGLQGAFFDGLKEVPGLAPDFAALIGDYFEAVPLTDEALLKIAPQAAELVAAETRLATGSTADWVAGTWEASRQTGQALDDGSTVVLKNSGKIIGEPPADGLFARVLPKDADLVTSGTGVFNTKQTYAFITAASDLEGLETSGQIAERLSLFKEGSTSEYRDLSGEVVLEFKFKSGFGPPAAPWGFEKSGGYTAGWIPGGETPSGAREWVVDTDLPKKGFVEIVGHRIIKPDGGSWLFWEYQQRTVKAANVPHAVIGDSCIKFAPERTGSSTACVH